MAVQKQTGFSSDDYVESLQAVTSDPFDSSSWKILLDEIEAGRGGNADFGESMSKFLGYFPRAGGEWIRYADYYETKVKDLAQAEKLLTAMKYWLNSNLCDEHRIHNAYRCLFPDVSRHPINVNPVLLEAHH